MGLVKILTNLQQFRENNENLSLDVGMLLPKAKDIAKKHIFFRSLGFKANKPTSHKP